MQYRGITMNTTTATRSEELAKELIEGQHIWNTSRERTAFYIGSVSKVQPDELAAHGIIMVKDRRGRIRFVECVSENWMVVPIANIENASAYISQYQE
jgi:hypothetical protein